MNASQVLKTRIEGMDCASCARKIENALARLPGVFDIHVSYGKECLSLKFDENRTSVATVEEKIRALGFVPGGCPTAPCAAGTVKGGRAEWWRRRKAALVAVIGVLFVTATIVEQVAPPLALWAWSIAAIVTVLPFMRRAWAGAVSGTPFTIETLMSVAAVGALLLGAAEEATAVIFLFALGEMLEGLAAGKARAGIESLIALVPRDALVEERGALKRVPVDKLIVGDVFIVRAGDRIPTDGKVIDGAADVDESPVSGESVPVAKTLGALVYAGSISITGELHVCVNRAAADNTISRIVHMVEAAQETKAPTARMIDRFSSRYTPVVMVVAVLVAVLPPLVFQAPWETWIYRALATLLVACPCALVISTPAAIASGLSMLARRGLLVKSGAALETLGRIRTVAFDKTGTLTAGRPRVTDVIALGSTSEELLAKAAAVELNSSHPLGVAIVAAANERQLALPRSFGGALTIPGKAITARLKGGGFVSVGSPRHAAEIAAIDDAYTAQLEALEQQGKTVVVVLSGKRVEGLIALRDEPREDAAEAIATLHRMGINTIIPTGDNRRTAEAVGAELNVRQLAELLPEEKLAEITALGKQGAIAMVGDGINDAPVLAAASVGIAMGGGTDVALETAEAALLRNEVVGVAELVAGSKATLRNIWQNVGLALGIKAIILCTTLLGITSLWMAILADTGATVLVTANALRLLNWQMHRSRS